MIHQEAIMAFSQSEKIKAGLIWVSQTLEYMSSLSDAERLVGERILTTVLEMVCQEVGLAGRLAGDEAWEKAENSIEQALVMLRSQAASGALPHLTQALSQVTSIGHRSMTHLKEEGLL